MREMNNIDYVSTVKGSMHVVFDSPQGKEVMAFLEKTCCWYQSCLVPGQPDMTMVNDGKRQVLATIKSILELSPEQIVNLVQSSEDNT